MMANINSLLTHSMLFPVHGSRPDKLQQVMVPMISNEKCNEPEWYGGGLDETMVCAGYEEGGRDACQVSSIHIPCTRSVV